MSELYDDHLVLDGGIQHRRVSQLKANNYNPDYMETRAVESESKDCVYLPGKVQALDVPFMDADASEDTVFVWVCSCDNFWFDQSTGVEDGEPPSSLGRCKHITSEVKVERARCDEGQETIV